MAPLLLLMVLGIIELGRTYFLQATISQAAREGARTLATGGDAAAVRAATRSAATGIRLTDAQIVLFPSTCAGAAASTAAAVTVSYPVEHLPGFQAAGTLLIGRGVMRCEG